MMIDELQTKWQSIATAQPSYQRIDAEHPLDFYIGKDADNFKELVLITEYEPSKMKSSKSVEVLKGRRNDGRWAIQIKLVKPEHEDVFVHLCWDLIETSRETSNQLHGLETVVARFIKWQILLEHGNGGLSEEAIKGLIGEIIYAKLILTKKHDLDTIVSSWLGPDGSDRDFIFNDTWTEVKAVGSGKTSICISSVEQLDTEIEGIIAVATIDSTSALDENGFSFANIIQDFKDLLKASPSALFEFEEKLINLGYYDRKEYKEKYYSFLGFRFFKVDNEFPKLTRDTLRNEIVRVKYEISLSAIKAWEVEVT